MCCEGMHGRVREHGITAVDQGVGEGVAQKGWSLAGFGVGEEPQESCGFITSTSSNFNPEDHGAASPISEGFRVGVFLGVPCSSSRPLELCLCIALPACVGARHV